ncbi:hypothetical protein [Flavobacterium sp. XGLA_31]|uniref:hypothetical protein n=1 Tax=Flavobacterium sp. XGLA_31 TaxID=3447666 RepID=UPI003F3E7E3E
MKQSLVILLLFFTFTVLSQNSEKAIKLIDAETNLPVADATVFVSKTKQTLLSNEEGAVTFVLNGVSNLQITHSSYVAVTIRSTTLKERVNVIYLKSSVTDLDEIIVTKQHPQKILKDLVENSTKRLTVPARLKVYSREFFKKNGDYSYYNDGLMNFQLFGNDKNFKSNILVEQNRSYGVVNEDITSDVLGYNLNDIMENYYNFKYLNPVLESKAKKEYDFIIKGYSANADYNLMLITPLDNAKGLLDDFKIIYDRKKKIIIEVSSSVSPTALSGVKDKTAVGSKNIYKSLFKTIYRVDNSNYYLVSSKEEIGFERIDKDKKTDIEVRNYFVTTNFSNHNFTYKDSEVFKDKTLYNKKNVILTDYWNVSGLTATEEEQAIILKMEDKVN